MGGGDLKLRTLGTVGVFRASGELLIGPGKPAALLVYLTAIPRRRTSRDHLLDLLWNNTEPQAARHALRQTTWYLRRHLGDDLVSTSDFEIALARPLLTDRDLFLHAVDSSDLATAVETYEGSFLPDFAVAGGIAFEHWAESERQRLRLLFTRSAESLVRSHLRSGRTASARTLARRLRDVDPMDEAGWRLVIAACLAHGDRVGALAEAQHLEQLLAAEDRPPDPFTSQKIREARNQPPVDAQDEERSKLSTDLVGREREFAALLAAAHRATEGSTQRRLVLGAPGLGKTRLLRDFGRHVRMSGIRVSYVRAQPADREVQWSFAAQVARTLSQLPGARGVSPVTASILVALDPSLAGTFSATPDPGSGEEARRRRFLALLDLIEAVADDRPLALLLDDLHWFDSASREVLEHIAQRLQHARILIAFAGRNAVGASAFGSAETVTLKPLGRQSIRGLLASIGALPSEVWADELPNHLAAATGGSPLLMLETLQLALESGSLALRDGYWACAARDELVEMLTAGSALKRRIERLDEPSRWLLLVLALAGTPLRVNELEAVAPGDGVGAIAQLRLLELRGLAVQAEDRWAVAHDEISAVTQSGATSDQRRSAHGALGIAHVGRSPRTTDAIRSAARHLALAGDEAQLRSVCAEWVRSAQHARDPRAPRQLLEELLGSESSALALRMYRQLPFATRWFRPGRVALLLGTVLLGMSAALLTRSPSSRDKVRLGVWRQESGHRRLYWADVSPTDALRGTMELTSLRPGQLYSGGWSDGAPRPGRSETAATWTYPDSGGVDVVLYSAGGQRMRRLTALPGDDWSGDWSPDGTHLVIATDRWNQRSHSDLGIIDVDHPASAIVQLTADQTARDAQPVWSPDGTRIAFLRTYPDKTRLPIVCVTSINAVHLDCWNPPGLFAVDIAGWGDAERIVAEFTDSTGTSQVLSVDMETRAFQILAEGIVRIQSRVAGWISCFCRQKSGEPWQMLLLKVTDPMATVRLVPGDPPPEAFLFPSGPATGYLDRLKISPPQHAIPVDGSYHLRLVATAASGAPVQPKAVQWRSMDTTVATVDTLGLLQPERQGTVTVYVTAGGWRSDSAMLTIGPAETEVVARESWDASFERRWVPFGMPRPIVVNTRDGSALAPNGDSTFQSGVWSRRQVPTSRGLGIEFEASTPITDNQWQWLQVSLSSPSPGQRASWNQETGQIDRPPWRTCGIDFPALDERGRTNLNLFGGLSRSILVGDHYSDGHWFRVRVQFFPDHRCGLAVDGQPRLMLDRRVPLSDSATVIIAAYSHRTRFLIRNLQIWTGVRHDVDWDLVENVR